MGRYLIITQLSLNTRMGRGCSASAGTFWVAGIRWLNTQSARKGQADLADGGNFVIKGKNPWHGTGKGVDAWQLEHYPFFEAIRNDKPYNELEYGAHSTMTAIMGRMATYSGKVIDWDKALNSEVNLAPSEYSWDAKPKPEVGADGLYPMPIPGDAELDG